jgi:hypothetical protein
MLPVQSVAQETKFPEDSLQIPWESGFSNNIDVVVSGLSVDRLRTSIVDVLRLEDSG